MSIVKAIICNLALRYDGEWHRWYAWRPIVTSGHYEPRLGLYLTGSFVWLNTVERRWDDGSSAWGDTGNWDYRLI